MIETWSFFHFVFLKNFTKSQKWYHCYSRSTLLSVLITKFVHEYNILWVFWLIFDHFISKKIYLFRHQILIIWKTCLWNPPRVTQEKFVTLRRDGNEWRHISEFFIGGTLWKKIGKFLKKIWNFFFRFFVLKWLFIPKVVFLTTRNLSFA